jgi:hypothetical protein
MAIGFGGHGLDPERVYPILLKTVHNPRLIGGQPHMDELFPSLEEACEYLGPTKALELLENVDLADFGKMLRFAKELASDYSHFYGLGDWATALSAFVEFQSENETQLIETGYSAITFDASPWLGRIMGNMYPTKPMYSEVSGCRWRAFATGQRFGVGRPCGYLDADPFSAFEVDELDRLKPSLRKKLIIARHGVLHHLIGHIRGVVRSGIGVERAMSIADDCLKAAKGIMTSTDIDFLNSLGTAYEVVVAESESLKADRLVWSPGGLSELIKVLGEVMCELIFCRGAAVRTALGYDPAPKPRVGIQLDLRAFYTDYASNRAAWFEDIFNTYELTKHEAEKFHGVFVSTMSERVSKYLPQDREVADEPTIVGEHTQLYAYELTLKTDGKEVIINGQSYGEIRKQAYDALAFILADCKKRNSRYFKKSELCAALAVPASRRVRDFFKGSGLYGSGAQFRLVMTHADATGINSPDQYYLDADLDTSQVRIR